MLLNLHSNHSLRYGTLSIEQIVQNMLVGGYQTGVLTDINNSSIILNYIQLCQQKGLNGLAGMEFRNRDQLLYIGIAKNREGFKELNELMTHANYHKKPLPERAPDFNHVFIIYPFEKNKIKDLKANEYIGIKAAQLNQIAFSSKKDQQKYVLLAPVSYGKKDYKLHCQLRAIDHNVLISQLKRGQVAAQDEFMIPQKKLLQQFAHFPKIIQNTQQLLKQCSFHFDFHKIRNKKSFTGNQYDDKCLLYKYTMDGFSKRYGSNNKIAEERIRKELDIIDNLNFSTYFLITDDICRYARSRGFHYVGRGSGANSTVAYCLGITDVDPIKLNLYFERFLNPKRKTPPDFDIDFSWTDRDEIYDYIFKRYQRKHTALMGAMSTFRSRSIIRELGKIYGLPKHEIDQLIYYPHHLSNKNEVTETILSVCHQVPQNFPNQRTIHSSGVLISEQPLTYYTALDYPPKGLPTAQFDMYTAEHIGFEKFDILSQRGIGHVKDCYEIIKRNRGKSIPVKQPKQLFKDPKIAQQLQSAHTVGCFYIESPAMRQLLSKLKCDNYLTLVAASSIIRPGVASSGMMKTYIERHLHPESVKYLHPVFEKQLKETYGVMVYQEDVMKIGHHYGGLNLADADVLRRMMSGKYRGKEHLKEIEGKYFAHCKKMSYPKSVSKEIWRQMASFAGYSFNKAHSASFAVESYQSLYLKTYHPLEFMVAVLNNYGGFYQRKVYLNEAQKAGGNICLPDVNKSQFQTEIHGKNIYLGFDGILHLERHLAQHITQERAQNGSYTGLENFILRTGAGLEQMIVLIRCGSFRFTGIGKKELLWEAHLLLSKSRQRETNTLFKNNSKKPILPKLETSLTEDLYDEIELMGFPVSGSMFDLLKTHYRGTALASDLPDLKGKTVRIVADFVCEKQVKTKSGKRMKFGTFLDLHGNFIDTIHFPYLLKKYPLNGNGVYLIQGKVVQDFGYPSIEVEKCARMSLRKDPRSE